MEIANNEQNCVNTFVILIRPPEKEMEENKTFRYLDQKILYRRMDLRKDSAYSESEVKSPVFA